MATRRLQVEIIGDASSLNRALGQAQTKTSRFGAVAKSALVGGAAAGLYALGKAAKIGWDEYNQGARVAAQTNAVIKSTGGAANVTADHVEDLGKRLMLLSGIDDELIKSGENVLLTFKKVRNEAGKGNDIFDQATKLALDLSVALGTDLKTANIQVGKALQGSSTGLTALVRSGVTFSDQQRELIGRLFATGHALEAQKMILAELRTEFGGSAKAAGDTFGGQLNILRERLNNFLGDLTAKAIPYLQRFIKWVGPVLSKWMEKAQEVVDVFRMRFNQMGEVLKRHQSTVNAITEALKFLGRVLLFVAETNIKVYSVFLKTWIRIVDVVLSAVDKIIAGVRRMMEFFRQVAGVARSAFGAAATAIRIMLGPIFTVINAVQRLIDLIHAIPSVDSLNPFHSSNAGVPTGRGGSGARGPTPRTIAPLPRMAGGSAVIENVLVLDGEVLYRNQRRVEARHMRRN